MADIVVAFSFCACGSSRELERLQKNVETAEAAYNRATQNTKDFQSAADSYEKAVEALK